MSADSTLDAGSFPDRTEFLDRSWTTVPCTAFADPSLAWKNDTHQVAGLGSSQMASSDRGPDLGKRRPSWSTKVDNWGRRQRNRKSPSGTAPFPMMRQLFVVYGTTTRQQHLGTSCG